MYTGPGLSIHCMQVHKETIDKVPNSLPNRSNVDIEIYGMEGKMFIFTHLKIKFSVHNFESVLLQTFV